MLIEKRSGPVGTRAAAYNTYTLHPSVADSPSPYREVWLDGYGAALTDVAERADALDQSWRPPTRRTPYEVRRDYLASLAPAEGAGVWLEETRRTTMRKLRFVDTPSQLTPARVAAGWAVSPLARCEWPQVAVPGGAG